MYSDDVIIPSGTLNAPIIMGGIVEVKFVTINANATLTINPTATLEIENSTSHGITSSGDLINQEVLWHPSVEIK